MNEHLSQTENDKNYQDAQKRVAKIKKFYKDLASWAGTSVFLIALDLFLSGGISWSKYPVFFWGIFIAMEFFNILRLQKLDPQWEKKMIRKFTSDHTKEPILKLPDEIQDRTADYSKELLRDPMKEEKELADLSEYRKLKRPWKDEDLV